MTTHGIVGSIFEEFVFEVRDQYAKDRGAPSIKDEAWLAGNLNSKSRVATPSIRFRRLNGVVQPTTRIGPHEHTLDNGKVIYFKSRYEDHANVECEIRAQDWVQLESIWTSLLSAAWDVLGGFSTPGDYSHESEDPDSEDPEFQKGSQLLKQIFVWKILLPQTTDSGAMSVLATVVGERKFLNQDEPGTADPPTTQT